MIKTQYEGLQSLLLYLGVLVGLSSVVIFFGTYYMASHEIFFQNGFDALIKKTLAGSAATFFLSVAWVYAGYTLFMGKPAWRIIGASLLPIGAVGLVAAIQTYSEGMGRQHYLAVLGSGILILFGIGLMIGKSESPQNNTAFAESKTFIEFCRKRAGALFVALFFWLAILALMLGLMYAAETWTSPLMLNTFAILFGMLPLAGLTTLILLYRKK